jgi:hypothetical protein
MADETVRASHYYLCARCPHENCGVTFSVREMPHSDLAKLGLDLEEVLELIVQNAIVGPVFAWGQCQSSRQTLLDYTGDAS